PQNAEERLSRSHSGAHPRPHRFGHAPRFTKGGPDRHYQSSPQGEGSLKMPLLMLKTRIIATISAEQSKSPANVAGTGVCVMMEIATPQNENKNPRATKTTAVLAIADSQYTATLIHVQKLISVQ